MTERTVALDDVFSHREIWRLRILGAILYSAFFGGIYFFVDGFSLPILIVTTSVGSAVAVVLTMSLAINTRPDYVDFEFEHSSSTGGWVFIEIFASIIMIWGFVLIFIIPLAILAQIVTLDFPTISCLLGGILRTMSVDWMDLDGEKVTIRKSTRASPRTNTPHSTATRSGSSQSTQSDSTSPDEVKASPTHDVSNQQGLQEAEQIRSNCEEVRTLIDDRHFTTAEYKLERIEDDVLGPTEVDDNEHLDVDSLRTDLRSLQTDLILEKARMKWEEGQKALRDNQFDVTRKKVEKAQALLSEAREFSANHQLDKDEEIVDVEAELEPISTLYADSKSLLSGAQDDLTKAQSSLKSEDVEAAKQSLDRLDEEIKQLPHSADGVVSELQEKAEEIQDKIAAVEDAEELVSTAQLAKNRSEHRLEDKAYEKARERAEEGLEACQKAEKMTSAEGLNTSESIRSLRSELKTLYDQATVGEPLQTAKTNLDSVRRAIESQSYATAENKHEEVEVVLDSLPEYDHPEIRELREESRQLKEEIEEQKTKIHLVDLLESVAAKISEAENHLSNGSFEQAQEKLESCEDALETGYSEINEPPSERNDDIESKLEDIKVLITLVEQARNQHGATERALQSHSYDAAESAASKLKTTVEEISTQDLISLPPDKLKRPVTEFEDEIESGRAENRLNGLFGSIESSRSRAKTLLEDENYERAKRRLESALENINEASALNDRHGFEKSDTISQKREAIENLLSKAERKPEEELSKHVAKAEEAVSRGINSREADDHAGAVEAFSKASEHYTTALELAEEFDLPEQWETEQRHSMVVEYLEFAREDLQERRIETREKLEEALDSAESTVLQAEQHAEVDDYVSARESLSEADIHLDEATQLLNVEGVTDKLQSRYDDVLKRAETLRDSLPKQEESGGYRNRDLVESLQLLATKLGESPRPEFVNAYGDYPADVYLDAFGSWPEALAAANLDPIDENARGRRSYSRVEVLDELVRLSKELGHPPSKNEMNNQGSMSATTVRNRFQDWDTALEIGGVIESSDSEEDRAKVNAKTAEKNTKENVSEKRREDLLAELQRLDEKWSDIDRKLLYSVSDYNPEEFEEAFGSLDAALEAVETGEHSTISGGQQSTDASADTKERSDEGRGAKRGFEGSEDIERTGAASNYATISGITDDRRIRDQMAVKVCEVSSSTGDRKQANVRVEDIEGTQCWLNIWNKHDVMIAWKKDHWYVLTEARGKEWTNRRGEHKRQLSSTKDFQVRHTGTTRPADTEEDALLNKSDQGITNNTSAPREDSEDGSDDILDEVMSEFDSMTE